jgi:hypothetical protein
MDKLAVAKLIGDRSEERGMSGSAGVVLWTQAAAGGGR